MGKSQQHDELRKSYISSFLLTETAKLLGSSTLTVVAGLCLGGVIALPIPTLAVLIASAVIGLYTLNKMVQHAHGFFKDPAKQTASPEPEVPSVTPLRVGVPRRVYRVRSD